MALPSCSASGPGFCLLLAGVSWIVGARKRRIVSFHLDFSLTNPKSRMQLKNPAVYMIWICLIERVKPIDRVPPGGQRWPKCMTLAR